MLKQLLSVCVMLAMPFAVSAQDGNHVNEDGVNVSTDAAEPAGFVALTAEMWHEWSAYENGEIVGDVQGMEYNVGTEVGAGGVVMGTGSVLGRDFADLSEYKSIYAEGKPGDTMRLLFNRPSLEGGSAPILEIQGTFNEEGIYTIDIEEIKGKAANDGNVYPYVHLNCIKATWGGPCTVNKFGVIAAVAPEMPELIITTTYTAGNSMCVLSVEPTTENGMLIYSLDGEEWDGVEGGITLAWTPGVADESGVCIFNVTVREVEVNEDFEIVKVLAEGFEQVSLAAPHEAMAGESAEEPIILATGWNEAVAVDEIGADEAALTHFSYNAEVDGMFVFSCGYAIKLFGEGCGMEPVEAASVRNAYGKKVSAGDVVTFSAYLPQAYEGVAFDENGEEIEGETELYDVKEYLFYANVIEAAPAVEPEGFVALTAEMWHEWSAYENGEIVGDVQGMEYNVGTEVGAGGVVMGTGSVLGRDFADLSNYKSIYAEGKPGDTMRLLFNRPSLEGGSAPILEIQGTFNEEGIYTIDIEEIKGKAANDGNVYPYVHLNCIKATWGGPCTVNKFGVIDAADAIHTVAAKNDNAIYNIAGQRVQKAVKSLYIINGKKVVLK